MKRNGSNPQKRVEDLKRLKKHIEFITHCRHGVPSGTFCEPCDGLHRPDPAPEPERELPADEHLEPGYAVARKGEKRTVSKVYVIGERYQDEAGRWYTFGNLVRFYDDCDYCDRMKAEDANMFPAHLAGRGCESGAKNHCTCDGCF